MPATKLEEVYRFCHNKPITLADFDEFYINADQGRGKGIFIRLKRKLTMLKVAERKGGEYKYRIDIIENIIRQRMEISLFEDLPY